MVGKASDNTPPQQQRGRLNLRAEKAQTAYTNFALVSTTPEEVVLNCGVNILPPTEQREVNVEISTRLIMSYPTAKRLAIMLGNVIQRYEQAHGTINVGPQTPMRADGTEASS